MSDNTEQPEIQAEPAPASGTVARLGRLRSVDPRDRRFSMPGPKTERTFRNWLSPGQIWDQGDTPMCVAYSTLRWLVTLPIVNHAPMPFKDFYHQCQVNDEWPGEDYDGTSVRGAFKTLKGLGFVSQYTWAFEPEQATRHLLEHGPLVIGIDWTDTMFEVDAYGYIHVQGQAVGGHAILVSGVNMNRVHPETGAKGAIRLLNSWGPSWGQHGHAWVSLDDFAKLMKGLDPSYPGEVATADEVRVR